MYQLMGTVGLWGKHHAVLPRSNAAVWHIYRMQYFLYSSVPASMSMLLVVKLLVVKLLLDHMFLPLSCCRSLLHH